MTGSGNEITQLAEEFASCHRTLLALGDENRQHLILEMMQMKDCRSVRVGKITQKTHLSRPAVSHHLRILKDAGMIRVRREGTKNYYSFRPDCEAIDALLCMLQHAKQMMRQLPSQEVAE